MQTHPIKIRLLAATALLAAALASAADDQPPPPQEVFRYVVFDSGDALEIDWAVEDGFYMYRSAFGFESGDGSVVLGEPELPEGKVYSDEFLGEQIIYRGNFFVRVPYTVEGNKPASIPLVINSRGCTDGGFCYMPQTWIETVALESGTATDAALEPGSLTGAIDSEFPPPDEVFFPDLFAVDGNTVELGIRIEPGFYVYKHKITAKSLSPNAQVGQLDLPGGKVKVDEFFGESEVYYHEVIAKLAVARATAEAMDLELEVGYQGCADGGLCYLPQTKVLTVSLPEATAVTDLSERTPPPGASTPPVSEQGRLEQSIVGDKLWVMIATFFGAGLLLAFTPCVLPMVPILSGIIAGEGDDVSPTRGFTLALSYVMGMAIVYTAAGVAAAMAGAQLQAAFNQPWVLTLFAVLFVVLSLGMFGAYDLQMPTSIQSKLANVSSRQKSGTMIGAFVMGALSSLVVTACVAPALIAALSFMAKTGDVFKGGTALFAMSMGMGAPLLLVGAAQGKLLPKVGPWMVAIKVAFGFMFLGIAVYMMSRVLPGSVALGLWAVLTFMAGVFLGGLTSLGPGATPAQKLGKGFGFLAIIYAVLMVIGASTGGGNPLQPLASVSFGGAGGDTVAGSHDELPFRRIKTVDDLDREIATASGEGKSVMLDFYADWCVSCKEMEAYTFTDPEVRDALSNTVWLQADVTRNDDDDKALLERFGVFGPPTIIFFGPDGRQRHGYEVVGYMKATAFAEHVEKAFTAASVTASASQ